MHLLLESKLSKIGKIEILNSLFTEVFTTPEVAEEYGENIPDFIKILEVSSLQKQKILALNIDDGESSAIALALKYVDCLIILDDYKARKVAQNLSLKVIGTLGVIIRAKQKGLFESVKPILQKIKETNFRISEELEKEILKLSDEL